jgi:hypothetical protein
VCWRYQAFNHLSVYEVGFHDFIDILQIHVGVPDAFRVHHGHRATRTPVHATSFVDPDLSGAGQICSFDGQFAPVECRLRLVLGAALFAVFAFIEAKEDVPLKVACFR